MSNEVLPLRVHLSHFENVHRRAGIIESAAAGYDLQRSGDTCYREHERCRLCTRLVGGRKYVLRRGPVLRRAVQRKLQHIGLRQLRVDQWSSGAVVGRKVRSRLRDGKLRRIVRVRERAAVL